MREQNFKNKLLPLLNTLPWPGLGLECFMYSKEKVNKVKRLEKGPKD